LPPSVKLIGQTAMASQQLTSIGGAAVEGIVFNTDWTPGGNTPAAEAFAKAFQAKTGTEADNWSALGYSYMMVVASAFKAASPNPTREEIRAAMANTKDVPVVVGSGKFSFVDRIPTYGTSFLMVKDGKFVPAPK
jgi:branched-chain amino acid transport system substrate-binding protein